MQSHILWFLLSPTKYTSRAPTRLAIGTIGTLFLVQKRRWDRGNDFICCHPHSFRVNNPPQPTPP